MNATKERSRSSSSDVSDVNVVGT